MKKQILIILFSIATTMSFAQSDKKICRDLDFLVQQTIDAINKRDANLYLSLVDYDAFIKTLEDAATKDSLAKAVYEKMKSKKELFNMVFQSSFSELIETIEKDLKTNKWTIELTEYYTDSKEEDPINVHHTLNLKIITNGTKYHLTMYATKHLDCFYIYEPLSPYFTSGW